MRSWGATPDPTTRAVDPPARVSSAGRSMARASRNFSSSTTSGTSDSLGERPAPISTTSTRASGVVAISVLESSGSTKTDVTSRPGTRTAPSELMISSWVGTVRVSRAAVTSELHSSRSSRSRPESTVVSPSTRSSRSWTRNRSKLASLETRLHVAVEPRAAKTPVPMAMTTAIAMTESQWRRRSRAAHRQVRTLTTEVQRSAPGPRVAAHRARCDPQPVPRPDRPSGRSPGCG